MHVIYVHGDKGGVGKSLQTKGAAEYKMGRGRKPILIDADTSNAHTIKAYSDAALVDLRAESGWEEALLLMGANPDRDFIIDLPADIGSTFDARVPVLQDGLAFGKLSPRVTCLFVLEPTDTSITQLRSAMECDAASAAALGRASWIEWVAVKNHGKLSNIERAAIKPEMALKEWAIWQNSKTRQMLLERGGREIEMPILSARGRALLGGQVSASEVLADEAKYSLADRSVVHRWLMQEAAQLDVAFAA